MGAQNYNEVFGGDVVETTLHACGSLSGRDRGRWKGGSVLMGLIKYLIFTLGGAELEVLSAAKLIRFRTCRQCVRMAGGVSGGSQPRCRMQ